MTKNETIQKHGKDDGYNEDRWAHAIEMSGLVDRAVSECFIGLIGLENKGLIKLREEK